MRSTYRYRREGVSDIELGTPVQCRGDVSRRHHRNPVPVFIKNDVATRRAGFAQYGHVTGANMFGQAPAPIRSTFQREPDNPAPRVTSNATRNWIVEIDNAVPIPPHTFQHHVLNLPHIDKALQATGAKRLSTVLNPSPTVTKPKPPT